MVCQCRRPHGEEGRKTLAEMNEGHRAQIQWGIDNLPEVHPEKILDVGCGGGIFARMALEKFPGSVCHGVDISEVSIEYALEANADLVSGGRLELSAGDAMSLPFDDESFDLVVSNASHFFWPDLSKGLSEICRVLKAGGVLCMTVGMHFPGEPDQKMREEYDVVNLLSDGQMLERLEMAGLEARCVPDPAGKNCAYYGVKG